MAWHNNEKYAPARAERRLNVTDGAVVVRPRAAGEQKTISAHIHTLTRCALDQTVIYQFNYEHTENDTKPNTRAQRTRALSRLFLLSTPTARNAITCVCVFLCACMWLVQYVGRCSFLRWVLVSVEQDDDGDDRITVTFSWLACVMLSYALARESLMENYRRREVMREFRTRSHYTRALGFRASHPSYSVHRSAN